MKLVLKIIIVFAVLSMFIACNQAEAPQQPETPPVDLSAMTLSGKVEYHIENNQYDEAFALVRAADQANPEVLELLLATHMTYALELTYGSLTDQRTRMPEALRHYRRVLELDPGNQRAVAEIEQIESIYRSLNREIPQGVAE